MLDNQIWNEKKCCQMALDVQNACNIGGVSHDFHILLLNIRLLYGWEYNYYEHPAVMLWHDKLADMLRMPLEMRIGIDEYAAAEAKCKKWANGDD